EPLGTAIALGRPDEGGRTLDAEEGDLRLEVVRHVLRSMVMPHGQTAGDRLAEPAEALPHALPDRLQGLEAGSLRMRVDPDTFSGAMIDRDKHRGLAFAGDCRRQVGAPHHVDRIGDEWCRHGCAAPAVSQPEPAPANCSAASAGALASMTCGSP